ncbi:MAG: hypothetical protein P8Z00_20295 [Anaerolineales bacterium]|jgi:hypothetical protein
MSYQLKARSIYLVLCLLLTVSCSQSPPAALPLPTATAHASISTQPVPSATTPPTFAPLAVSLLYPNSQTEVKMGQSIKLIVQVTGADAAPATAAQVSVTIKDPSGAAQGTIPLAVGKDGAFRSENWTVPHRNQAGSWQLVVEARTPTARGQTDGTFQVKASTSEELLAKYGFWLDAPTLRDIVPTIMGEEGDAQNGMVRWGGFIPAQHVLPENWIDVQWRSGDFHLDSPQAVRQFMFTQLGNLSMYPTRAIGPFEQVKFKHWDAWKVGGRGQYQQIHQEWMIFYAPEVDKTYSLGTLVILPPSGINPHAALRKSFEVYPDLHADGVAPEPLPHLLPIPQLITPTLGESFVGIQKPIVLKWEPLKDLAKDEYYRVQIQFNFGESTPLYTYATSQTQFTVPNKLYSTPNCRIFNWQVTLMRKTGEDQDGQPVGKPLSYSSLYWYFEWSYPPGQNPPFTIACPNAQT